MHHLGSRLTKYYHESMISKSIVEIYKEDIARFRALVGTDLDENPMAVLEKGGIPQLKALRLHNGTIYRWPGGNFFRGLALIAPLTQPVTSVPKPLASLLAPSPLRPAIAWLVAVPSGTFTVLPLALWARLWSRRSMKRVATGIQALRLVKVFANDEHGRELTYGTIDAGPHLKCLVSAGSAAAASACVKPRPEYTAMAGALSAST